MNKKLLVASLFLASSQASAGSFSDQEFRTLLTNAQNIVNSDVQEFTGLCDKSGNNCDWERGKKLEEKLDWHVSPGSYRTSINTYDQLKVFLDRIPASLSALDKKEKAGKIKSYADSSFDLYGAFRNANSIDVAADMLHPSNRGYFSAKTQDALRDLNRYATQMKGYDKRVLSIKGWPNE